MDHSREMSPPTPSYRALIKRSANPSAGALLHLIRDYAEASLCGIPRPSLGPGGSFDELVCAECLDWFEKRRAVSGKFPKSGPDAPARR
jgi:hypothetical protein